MRKQSFIDLVQKLPDDCNILVRGGAACNDDAWEPTIRVFSSGNSPERITAVVEMNCIRREHYNYPEHYSGVTEITDRIFTRSQEQKTHSSCSS